MLAGTNDGVSHVRVFCAGSILSVLAVVGTAADKRPGSIILTGVMAFRNSDTGTSTVGVPGDSATLPILPLLPYHFYQGGIEIDPNAQSRF